MKQPKYLTAHTPYDKLIQKVAWSELEPELMGLLNDYHKLMNQLIKTQKEGQSLGDREREAYLKWVGLARGKKYDSRKIKNFGFTPEELNVGIKSDKSRDEMVYRQLLKERTLENAQEKIKDHLVKTGGRIFLQAVESEDTSHLRVLETFVELVKRGETLSNQGLFLFFLLVGEAAEGKLKRETRFSISMLASACKRDRKTIRDWCKHYEVTPTAQKRGPRKKP